MSIGSNHPTRIPMGRKQSPRVLPWAGLAVALIWATSWAAATKPPNESPPIPIPGPQAYTHGEAMNPSPPDRLGGPLKVTLNQTDGVTYFALPGPRELDPSVFGTPKRPVGFDPAPFPLLGIPLDRRLENDGHYTLVNGATPFSDWAESGKGSVHMTVVDATALDGKTSKDTVDFDATFKSPDGATYRVTCNKVLPHGLAYPFFGGVVTNQLMHGVTGIGTRLMPTEFAYAAFWGTGDVYKNGKKIAEGNLIHGMLTQYVRGEGYKLLFDPAVGKEPNGTTFHLIVAPFKPTPSGLKSAPLMTGFDPFPYIQKHMQRDMEEAQSLTGRKKANRLAELKQVKTFMAAMKENVQKATKAGKMDGQPFFHVMFNDYTVSTGK